MRTKIDKVADAGVALIHAAGDGTLTAAEHKALTAKLEKILEDLSADERDYLWGELFAEPLAMLAPVHPERGFRPVKEKKR